MDWSSQGNASLEKGLILPLWHASCIHSLLILFFSMQTSKVYLNVYISSWLNITLGLHPCMLGICSVKELCSPTLITLLSRTRMKNIWSAQRWRRTSYMAIDHFSRPRLGKSSLQVHTENRICILTDNELYGLPAFILWALLFQESCLEA